MDDKSPEEPIAESQPLMDESQQRNAQANTRRRVSLWVIIGGCTLPCLVLVALIILGNNP